MCSFFELLCRVGMVFGFLGFLAYSCVNVLALVREENVTFCMLAAFILSIVYIYSSPRFGLGIF